MVLYSLGEKELEVEAQSILWMMTAD